MTTITNPKEIWTCQRSTAEPLEQLFIAVGKKLIQKGSPTPYFTMAQITKAIHDYRIRIPGTPTRSKDLAFQSMCYFEKCGDLAADGLKVIWRTEQDGRKVQSYLKFETAQMCFEPPSYTPLTAPPPEAAPPPLSPPKDERCLLPPAVFQESVDTIIRFFRRRRVNDGAVTFDPPLTAQEKRETQLSLQVIDRLLDLNHDCWKDPQCHQSEIFIRAVNRYQAFTKSPAYQEFILDSSAKSSESAPASISDDKQAVEVE